MGDDARKTVKVGPRLAKFIGAKASRESKLQAAGMQAEFTLKDTLIMLSYLGRDPDPEIAVKARQNLIPAVRAWNAREDKPELPEPIYQIVMKVLERVGPGEAGEAVSESDEKVRGNIGLLGLGEIIQAVDHNNRTVWITLSGKEGSATVFTENGKVVGAVLGDEDGLDALYEAFAWADADFVYMHESPGRFKKRININTLNLVMDALERAPDLDPFDTDASLSWKVEGHLKIMNVFELAEIFEMNSRQCMCKLTREEAQGVLYFSAGRIINAQLGDMTGMDAACHLLAWPSARFEIVRGGDGISEVIHIGMQNLIIEAMRLLDEGVTVTDRIASELELINELFEGRDVVTLPVLDRVRLVFGEDAGVREVLEQDSHPVVRKAVKVKISKTVHKYLSAATDLEQKLKAALGKAPLSTTEKLVLLAYLSHDELPQVQETAKKTLAELDSTTYRKGLGAELHPSVTDFLVREAIRDETVIRIACSTPNLLPETALHVLDNWKGKEILGALLDNTSLLEKSSTVAGKLYQALPDYPELRQRLDSFEQNFINGLGETKVEGPLTFCGIAGLLRAAKNGVRSGAIVLESPGLEGRIFFTKGRITGALLGSLAGRPALEKMVEMESAKFRYILRTHFQVQNIEASTVEDILASKKAGPIHDPEFRTGLHLLSGSLDTMDIYEVLSALEDTPVPMAVSVICEEGSGLIYRDGSRVLHVRVDGKDDPYDAMAALLAWNGSRFIVRLATESFPTTVSKSLEDFFTEAMTRVPDEMKLSARPGELPEWELSEAEFESLYHRILEMGVSEKIKFALTGNKEARGILVRDPNKMVAVAVAKSPKIQLPEIEGIAKSRNVCEDVLREIADTKAWMKVYSVKLNLVGNPKTPVPIALKLLSQLRELDLRRLGKSKEVSAIVQDQARRLAIRMGERSS
jgi:hypothetical protein